MDEAARCTRVGFMRSGKLLLEGTPENLRTRLNGRIVEVRGQPLLLMREIAKSDPDIEDAQMFGDRLHLRARPGKTQEVIARLGERIRARIPAGDGQATLLRVIPPQLEDVFIALLEK
jgi:ABC-2 type transport system ATP-binding protein